MQKTCFFFEYRDSTGDGKYPHYTKSSVNCVPRDENAHRESHFAVSILFILHCSNILSLQFCTRLVEPPHHTIFSEIVASGIIPYNYTIDTYKFNTLGTLLKKLLMFFYSAEKRNMSKFRARF